VYCLQCRVEFREGFKKCSDCGVALVAALPPEPPTELESDPVEPETVGAPFDGMVVIMDTVDTIKIAMAKGILRDAGIPFYATGEFYGARSDYGWRQILVERGREADAREALRVIEEGRPYLL
jgi:hypothetical protein